ncbi:MAG: TonB-dependent receptor [Halioglobus sp.]
MAKARLTGGQATNFRRSTSRTIAWLILNCSLVISAWAQDSSAPKNVADRLNTSRYQFVIDAKYLPDALIQFSQQSGRAIVFPGDITRNIVSPPFIGEGTLSAVLDILLEPSELTWELVDRHIIAISETRCEQNGAPQENCASSEDVLSKHPVYDPGIGQTYVYGTRVTGSRIRHTRYEQASPVDIISAPDIELSGAQSVGELLKFVPAVSGNSISTAISNGGNGTATVTLRGLPSSNTLVLINGRRVANDGLAGESVDLNSIPPAAVERIEILKGGASAIYGSDAIAGVVNIIMKQHFHGLLAETYFGETSRGDLQTRTHTLQYGTAIPNGSFFINISDYGQEDILSANRRVSRSADSRSMGGVDLRSSATEAARVTLPDDTAVILDQGQYRPATNEDLFDFRAFTTAVVPLDRTSVYSNVSYDFTERISGLFEFQYLETEAEATLAPTPIFTAFERIPLTISQNNRFNPFGADIADARRRLVELPPRVQRNDSEVTRFSAVVEGLLNEWNWDISYNWSRSEASERVTNLVNADNLQRGLGPSENCQGLMEDGCVAVNLFGPPGSISPQQLDFIGATGGVSGHYKLSVISVNASNETLDFDGRNMALAFGAEYRNESTSKKPSNSIASINTIGGSNFEPTRGDRQIAEFYAETVVPGWESADGSRTLDLEAALRFSNYSDFGSTTNPRLGLRFAANSSYLVRLTYAKGFRAPSLNELFRGASEDQAFLNDPCTLRENVGVLPGCSQQADPTRNQFLTVIGGNEDLEPEDSESYGLGLVWTPQQFPGITASVDFFRLNQDNVVDSSAQFIVNQNALTGNLGDQIQRDSMGNLQLVEGTNLNVGKRKISASDFSLTYHHKKRPWGQLSFTGSGTYIHKYKAKLDSTAPELDLAGTFQDEASEGLGGIPQWKGQLGIQWNHKRWRGNYEMHFISSLEEVIPGTTEQRDIDSWMIHDVQLSYKFKVLKGLRWAIGIDNLLDEEAPLATSAFNDSIDGRTHELKGRFLYTKLSQRF